MNKVENFKKGCSFLGTSIFVIIIITGAILQKCGWDKADRDISKYSEVDIHFLNPIFENYNAVIKNRKDVIEEEIPPSFNKLLDDIPNKKIALSGSIHEVQTHPNDNKILLRYEYYDLSVFYEFKLVDPIYYGKGDFVKIYGTIAHLEYRWVQIKFTSGVVLGGWELYVCVKQAFTNPNK